MGFHDSDVEADSDDDDKTTTEKDNTRASQLVEHVAAQYGCTFANARAAIADNPQILAEYSLSKKTLKQLSCSTTTGREKEKKRIFKKVLEESIFQTQLMQVMRRMSQMGDMDTMVKKCFKYPWADGLLELYMLKICEMDLSKLKEKYKGDEAKTYKYGYAYLRMQHQFLKGYFWDKLLAPPYCDLRAQALNALEYLLNPEMEGTYYPRCYEAIRSAFKVKDFMITENFIPDYGNEVKGEKYVVDNSHLSKSQRAALICIDFNRGDCPRGASCQMEHVCYLDFGKNHGAFQCFSVRDYFKKNGQLASGNPRLDRSVGDKRTRRQRDQGGVRVRDAWYPPRNGNRGNNNNYNNNGNRGNGNYTRNGNRGNNNNNTAGATSGYMEGPPGSDTVRINGQWYNKSKIDK